MPQCICGRFFKQTSYAKEYHKEDDLCPACRLASLPDSYIHSKEWTYGEADQIIQTYSEDE